MCGSTKYVKAEQVIAENLKITAEGFGALK